MYIQIENRSSCFGLRGVVWEWGVRCFLGNENVGISYSYIVL